MRLEIRIIKETEYQIVNDFYNNTRGINLPVNKTFRKYDEFCWEFTRCQDRRTVFAGAWEVEDGKEPHLIGTQCIIIHKMISSYGNRFLAAKGEDTLIEFNASVKYENTDILKELFDVLIDECSKSGVEYLWGFNNIPASSKRLGFENPFKSSYAVLVINPFKAFKNIRTQNPENANTGKFKRAFLLGIAYLYSYRKMCLCSQKQHFHINFELDENIQLFQRAAFPDHLILLQQDDDYFKWRIEDNPYPIKYRSYQLLDQDNTLFAQVICSIDDTVAFIEQTLFDKSLKNRTVNFMLRKVISALEDEGVCLVRHIGFKNCNLNKLEMKYLKNSGFISTGKGEWFTFKKLLNNPSINPENIYLSRLYKQGTN
ncbi:MAG: hypothetical protein AB9834_01150 [Lentimicrobium sp.]